MSVTYSRYSTSFKYISVLRGKRPLDVPKSTFSGWNKAIFDQYKGIEIDKTNDPKTELYLAIEKSKKLEKMCLGMAQLNRFYQDLISQIKNKATFFRSNKDKFIETFEALKQYFSVTKIEEYLQVKSAQLTRWKQIGKCQLSFIKLCILQNINQIELEDTLKFRDMVLAEENEHMPINHIWTKAFREAGIIMCLNSAYKLTNGIKGDLKKVKTKKQKNSITATRPFEILHMDSTLLVLENKEKVYLHFIMDNYSRMILGAVISHSSKSSAVVENLRHVIQKYNLEHVPFELYCDGGPENQGEVNEFIANKKVRVTKIIANYLDETSNNMAEAWHKKFKQFILKKFPVNSLDELKEILPAMLEYANNLYLPVLKALSPIEAINGMKPEDLNYKELAHQAQLKRRQNNKAFNCKLYCT